MTYWLNKQQHNLQIYRQCSWKLEHFINIAKSKWLFFHLGPMVFCGIHVWLKLFLKISKTSLFKDFKMVIPCKFQERNYQINFMWNHQLLDLFHSQASVLYQLLVLKQTYKQHCYLIFPSKKVIKIILLKNY